VLFLTVLIVNGLLIISVDKNHDFFKKVSFF